VARATGSSAMAQLAQTGYLTPDDISEMIMHQHYLDRRNVHLQFGGMICGLITALAFLGAATYLIATNHDTAGSILGTVDLVALVAIFVTRRRAG
jgi:uncharacterized membrane protein